MAIRSGFFNSVNGDRKYDARRFAEYFASFIGNGVFPNPSNNLQVIANDDMTITVKAGKAWINGYIMINDDDYILEIAPADGVLNRIDRVVARYDTVNREIRLEVKKGTFASNPTAPELQRDADAYELGLADIYIAAGSISISQADITDLRLNSELCGIVHGTVEQVDTTTLFNQYLAWLQEKKSQYDQDMLAWTEQKKNEFEDWAEAQEQGFEAWRSQEEQNFYAWLEHLQDILDENVAGNLLNLIESHKTDRNNPHGVTAEQIGAETPAGAQEKANQAEANAKAYTDQQVSTVANDLASHKADYATLDKAGHVKAETDADGRLIIPIPKSNYNADRPPTKDDDETQGYSPGSMWFVERNNRTVGYICISSAQGEAVWKLLGSSFSAVSFLYHEGDTFEEITGGWIGGEEVEFQDNCIQIQTGYYGRRMVRTILPVSLDGVNKVCVAWHAYSPGNVQSFVSRIIISDNPDGDLIDDAVAFASNYGAFDYEIIEIDVRHLSGDYFIKIATQGGDTYIIHYLNVYSVFLE